MNENLIQTLSTTEVENVSGGVLPVAWLVAGAVTGAFGAGFTAGYTAGSDKWGD